MDRAVARVASCRTVTVENHCADLYRSNKRNAFRRPSLGRTGKKTSGQIELRRPFEGGTLEDNNPQSVCALNDLNGIGSNYQRNRRQCNVYRQHG